MGICTSRKSILFMFIIFSKQVFVTKLPSFWRMTSFISYFLGSHGKVTEKERDEGGRIYQKHLVLGAIISVLKIMVHLFFIMTVT